MLYVATERPGWLVVGGLLFVAGAYVGFLLFGHVQARVDIWLDPFDPRPERLPDRRGHVRHGLGRPDRPRARPGQPDADPFAESDFIVAAIGEELGLTGVMAVILLYGLIVERALRTALVCRDGFGKLVAIGLGVVFALQVFVVIGGVTRLIPLTGLTTPFLSYGGSSLVANWVIIALLLRISDQARRPLPDLSSSDAADHGDDATQVVKLHEQADPHDVDLLHAALPGAAGQRDLPAVRPGRRPQRPATTTGG